MMIPEAWENHAKMDPARRAFYEFHSTLMEPWDGPAAASRSPTAPSIGAVLDRNGLRPARCWVTEDGLVVLASEVGVLDVEPSDVSSQGPAGARPMFLVDTAAGPHRRRRRDQGRAGRRAPVRRLAARRPDPARRPARPRARGAHPRRRSRAASRRSATPRRSCSILLKPMAATGAEPIGSMGTDAPLAALSERPRLLFDYFKQLFAQVTNPPLDAIREELVTSLREPARPGAEPARRQRPPAAARSCCRSRCSTTTSWPRSSTSTTTATSPGSAAAPSAALYDAADGGGGAARAARRDLRRGRRRPSTDGARLLVLSDRGVDTHRRRSRRCC